MPTRSWKYDEDRSYHGRPVTNPDGDQWQPATIVVELTEWGPTERKSPRKLRTLKPRIGGGDMDFGWGYNGGATSVTADAILLDALGAAPSDELREAFCEDVIAHLSDEFRLRRGAILRWARGWAVQHNAQTLPNVLTDLPPVSTHGYESPPRRR